MLNYKLDDNAHATTDAQVKDEQPWVIISGRSSLALNMQNRAVIESLYDSLNPEREKNIINLQAEINQLRKSQGSALTVSYNDNSTSNFKANTSSG